MMKINSQPIRFILGLGFVVAFTACGNPRLYERHVLPGAYQAYHANDSIFILIQFDQVFTPKEKRDGWDHPTGRRRGGYQWAIEIRKDQPDVVAWSVRRASDLDALEVLSFNSNLSRFFHANQRWHGFALASGKKPPLPISLVPSEGSLLVTKDSSILSIPGFQSVDRPSAMFEAVENYMRGSTVVPLGFGSLPSAGIITISEKLLSVKTQNTENEILLIIDSSYLKDPYVLKVENVHRTVSAHEIDQLPDL